MPSKPKGTMKKDPVRNWWTGKPAGKRTSVGKRDAGDFGGKTITRPAWEQKVMRTIRSKEKTKENVAAGRVSTHKKNKR